MEEVLKNGISPENKLSPRDTKVRLDKEPSEDGIVPNQTISTRNFFFALF
jgi:hypothetical protein